MPKEIFDKNYPYLSHSDLLSFEEIIRLTNIFASLGVEKIRLTGNEPLLRKNLEVLIEMLAKIRTTADQALDLTLTYQWQHFAQEGDCIKSGRLASPNYQS